MSIKYFTQKCQHGNREKKEIHFLQRARFKLLSKIISGGHTIIQSTSIPPVKKNRSENAAAAATRRMFCSPFDSKVLIKSPQEQGHYHRQHRRIAAYFTSSTVQVIRRKRLQFYFGCRCFTRRIGSQERFLQYPQNNDKINSKTSTYFHKMMDTWHISSHDGHAIDPTCNHP